MDNPILSKALMLYSIGKYEVEHRDKNIHKSQLARHLILARSHLLIENTIINIYPFIKNMNQDLEDLRLRGYIKISAEEKEDDRHIKTVFRPNRNQIEERLNNLYYFTSKP